LEFGKIRRLPNIFESREYAPGPRTNIAADTSMLRVRSAAWSPFTTGQDVASITIESMLANGVIAPRQRRIHVMHREIAFHVVMLSAGVFERVETISRPAIVVRKRNKATPGNPAGNIEKSLCIRRRIGYVDFRRLTRSNGVTVALSGPSDQLLPGMIVEGR
jgi:hypothetical protein